MATRPARSLALALVVGVLLAPASRARGPSPGSLEAELGEIEEALVSLAGERARPLGWLTRSLGRGVEALAGQMRRLEESFRQAGVDPFGPSSLRPRDPANLALRLNRARLLFAKLRFEDVGEALAHLAGTGRHAGRYPALRMDGDLRRALHLPGDMRSLDAALLPTGDWIVVMVHPRGHALFAGAPGHPARELVLPRTAGEAAVVRIRESVEIAGRRGFLLERLVQEDRGTARREILAFVEHAGSYRNLGVLPAGTADRAVTVAVEADGTLLLRHPSPLDPAETETARFRYRRGRFESL